MALPAHYTLTYSAAEISAACTRLGGEISRWAQQVPVKRQTAPNDPLRDLQGSLLTIPILRGGLFFYADLVRAIDCSVELITASASSYSVAENKQSDPSDFRSNVEGVAVQGRHVLLVDDICDSGNTLARLKHDFLDRGALEVRTAALIRRVVPNSPHVPDYVGFVYEGQEWFVGYGMDDLGQYRNLGAVYRMQAGK